VLHAKLRNRTCQGLDRQGQGPRTKPTRTRTRTTAILARTRTRINITAWYTPYWR